jgi:hypothetical protein
MGVISMCSCIVASTELNYVAWNSPECMNQMRCDSNTLFRSVLRTKYRRWFDSCMAGEPLNLIRRFACPAFHDSERLKDPETDCQV